MPLGFQRYTASTLFQKLLCTGADVTLEPSQCIIALKKKRNLPALLETLAKLPHESIPWLGNGQLVFLGATRCQPCHTADRAGLSTLGSILSAKIDDYESSARTGGRPRQSVTALRHG